MADANLSMPVGTQAAHSHRAVVFKPCDPGVVVFARRDGVTYSNRVLCPSLPFVIQIVVSVPAAGTHQFELSEPGAMGTSRRQTTGQDGEPTWRS
jgi:hypothetical protein